VENPLDLVMNRPKPVTNYQPNEPIFLTAEQWAMVCDKTRDATTPFTVTITVTDNKEDTLIGDVRDLVIDDGVEEQKEEPEYVPKRVRKNKK
jgi:hypothetical protein